MKKGQRNGYVVTLVLSEIVTDENGEAVEVIKDLERAGLLFAINQNARKNSPVKITPKLLRSLAEDAFSECRKAGKLLPIISK